jgi:hypothetical protein
MSEFRTTEHPDPFTTGGWNGENATDPAPNRAGDHQPIGVGMAAQPGDIPAAVPPNRSETMLEEVGTSTSIEHDQMPPPPVSADPGGAFKDADAEALKRFREWLETSRETDRLAADDNETEYDAAADRLDDIEDQIMAMSGGGVVLAIKSYLAMKADLVSWTPASATLRCPEMFEEDVPSWNHRAIVSVLRDVAKQVPEIAELVAPIIHEDALLIDADIEIQWCRDRLAEKLDDEIQEQLAELLDRVAKAEAKTPRGREIKSRRLAEEQAAAALPRLDPVLGVAARSAAALARCREAERAGATVEALSPLEDELGEIDDEYANVTAATWPGLVAHIDRLNETIAGSNPADLVARLIRAATEAIGAMAGVPAANDERLVLPSRERPATTLPALLDQLRLIEQLLIEDCRTTEGWWALIQRREVDPKRYVDFQVQVCRQIITGLEAIAAAARQRPNHDRRQSQKEAPVGLPLVELFR